MCLFICLAVIPLGAVTFKICPCSPKRPSKLLGTHKQNEFSYYFIRVQHSFYESYPSVYNATSPHLMLNKLSHPCAPQGVAVSLLCRDVLWLTEEVLFRSKDVGFGGSVTQIVHYSLSLLAPYLIIAATPTWLVFSKRNESPNVLLIKSLLSSLVKPLLHFNSFFSLLVPLPQERPFCCSSSITLCHIAPQ